jgi:hypothetical protein
LKKIKPNLRRHFERLIRSQANKSMNRINR